MTSERKQYLGDLVYAEYVGCDLILTTAVGFHNVPMNKIVLGPEVRQLLMNHVSYKELERLRSEVKALKAEREKQ
jgi:hypothetical protein